MSVQRTDLVDRSPSWSCVKLWDRRKIDIRETYGERSYLAVRL